ncbi:rhodanese-like domain-containing protein [Nodosilinea sp. P-1105]|uniref:rhodanese-like domain-containing protein n=1 Tax=Nodosilinea sp. P-1105 TaxID=2546229 RepID=UPI00146C859C|nr:rhodanese-like domain-containing protein [Nodosilinea sp. P-1105]NMF83211.1 rhodanese-like domain-containing protein [Nodosilinea sp. P-1105]
MQGPVLSWAEYPYLTQPLRRVAWSWMAWWVRVRFPTVETLSPQRLELWLQQDSARSPLLLDARTAEEFAVSHLPQARHAPNLEAALALDLAPQHPIVVYCSVGYRSARLAAQLQQQGFTQVQNLIGSLFLWANQGRPLQQNGQVTRAVHPYNLVWGLLLEPQVERGW